jgi:F-type H+-transporting ATPase subunit b
VNFLIIAFSAETVSDKNPLIALTPGLYIWTIITFLLLLYVLAKFAWKPLLKMLEDRENLIKKSLNDAEKAKLELERLNEESEAITAKARSEAQSILAESKATAEKVKEDIIAKAKEQEIKLHDDAQKKIEVAKDKAISDIKQEVVNLTLSVSEKLINKNLNDADNKSLIEESLKKVKSYEA